MAPEQNEKIKDDLTRQFKEVFEQKMASGLPNNVAAVEALRWLESIQSKQKIELMDEEDTDNDEPDAIAELKCELLAGEKGRGWGSTVGKVYRLFSSIDELRLTFGQSQSPERQQQQQRKRRKRENEKSLSGHDNGEISENEDRLPALIKSCFASVLRAARNKEAIGNALSNALEALALDLITRQGDPDACVAWIVALEHPDLSSNCKLLRAVLVSLGGCGHVGRAAFAELARHEASAASRRRWGTLAQDQLALLVAQGADHGEILLAARACDVLRQVDATLDAVCGATNDALNDRLSEDDHIIHEALRAWLPDEPRVGVKRDARVSLVFRPAVSRVDLIDNKISEEHSDPLVHENSKLSGEPPPRRDARLERAGTSILSYPYLLDAASKARFLKAEGRVAMRRAARNELQRTIDTNNQMRISPFFAIRVRRDYIVQDAVDRLVKASGDDLRKQIKVHFAGEDGVDEGGVANEFMQIVSRSLLKPGEEGSVFSCDSESNALWFARKIDKTALTDEPVTSQVVDKQLESETETDNNNGEKTDVPHIKGDGAAVVENQTEDMSAELVGILLGVAIHNAILVEAPFAKMLWKKLLDPLTVANIEDLEDAAPAIARSLRALHTSARIDDAFTFQEKFGDLTFRVGYEDASGKAQSVDLVPDGDHVFVTVENVNQYIRAYLNWYFDTSVASPFAAFKRGFDRVVEAGDVWRLLEPNDLELLVRGSSTLDFDALEANALYQDGYNEHSPTIVHFWQVVKSLDHDSKLKLLKFVTGTDRAPISGLGAAKFIISRSGAVHQLPSSHTCFSHLVLPDYNDIDILRKKLLIALSESSEGFGLR
uniref:HECT-type E3 ubiquitin transferase n=1 Tax=Aureoumbra lagunensis TaxID=44058 RepID=A0A7S3JYV2_9STRA|eukprot:CAMPEP_0197324908 /NCGR_PEP_ID=MMETSP0891-20130614/71373_1 /TAXON_ID=44058 ORGANISM="Aureoumbra lagunensis, Strain CCMP1510" /NCGR_SAMPLE_ID=MMETSP0891 /ASSEMBLY_ACC=CAM_ASM_000534 /LENGTH=832 /DNA_ID=CAMNT_0042817791 /DNA_START=2212 /DNA_END=4710 /DNA_ORIENTATION=+